MQVPLLDLKQQYAAIKDEIWAEVREVLKSQRYIGGPKVAELEEKVAAYSSSRYAVGVSSGSDALLFALRFLWAGVLIFLVGGVFSSCIWTSSFSFSL